MAKSLGEKHNNYLNVKNKSGNPWMDAGGKPSKSDGNGHAIFTDPAWGVRAGILNLRAYFFNEDQPRRTIAQILARWAPVTDTVGSLPGGPPNSPKKYALFVSGRMGIGPNDRLRIFDEDRSLGHLGELRSLFYAMAAYECGNDFKVPDKHFNAGVELLEPGILKNGTESTYELPPDNEDATAAASDWLIGSSVGAGGANAKNDVATVQEMLRNAAMILGDPSVDPRASDGEIDPNPKKSPTVLAIAAFQSRFFAKPDGLIDVGGRTWRELMGVLVGGPQTHEVPEPVPGAGEFFFPLAKIPDKNWTDSPRSFGANRKGGRAHAGCDLYAKAGTLIYAVADGVVTRGPVEFYYETFALEIDHGSFLVRYGEVQAETFVSKGDKVRAGQPIARVGHLVGLDWPYDMLHFELYSKKASGFLTVGLAESLRAPDGRPYLRRKDLIDPTDRLKEWAKNLPGTIQPLVVPSGPATAPALSDLPKIGFVIHLKRVREEKRNSESFARTVGKYQCYWNGEPIADLAGDMVERNGPGDNTTAIGDNGDRRIRKGVYPLSVHYGGSYRTTGYSTDPTGSPRPGLLLKNTGERTWILIHPGKNYISSVGCLNPTAELVNADTNIRLPESRLRVIAIIDEIRKRLGPKFPQSGTIPDALIVITGLT